MALTVDFGIKKDEELLLLQEDYELGGNKSLHYRGENAYVRIYPAGSEMTITVSGGTWRYFSKSIKEERKEFIPFADSGSGKLKYPAVRVLNVSASAGVVPFVGGRRVRFREDILGCCAVSYETDYDIIEVTGTEQGYVVLKAEGESGTAYITLDYTEEETDVSERLVIITARDAASRESIENAEVFLNGTYRGLTDGGGMLNLGRLKKGTYSLFVRKEGYLDTDKDNLRNDSFKVE